MLAGDPGSAVIRAPTDIGYARRMNLRLTWIPLLAAAIGCGPDPEPTSSGGGSGGEDSGGTVTPAEETGVDGTAGSTGSELPDIDCETTLESDLPGVSIAIQSDCTYSIAQAQAGLDVQYVVDITEALPGVDSGTMCYGTPRGGVHVEWRVEGSGHHHCHCDVGLCPDYVPAPTTLVPGQTMGSVEWFAYDWDGPSDYDPPFGPAFEPGQYVISVQATGFWDDGVRAQTPFTVRATRPVTLVP